MTKVSAAKCIKAATLAAEKLLRDVPETQFNVLVEQSDLACEANDLVRVTVLDETIRILAHKDDVAAIAYNKLVEDAMAIDTDLVDECMVAENVGTRFQGGAIGYWSEYYRHLCGVVSCLAENKGIKINERLGYPIY